MTIEMGALLEERAHCGCRVSSIGLVGLANRDAQLREISWLKKLKLSHYMPSRHLGKRRYSSYSLLTSTLDVVSGQRHAPTALYTRGKDTRYPLDRRLGGPQSRFGHSG
jgi:hypothetical protein